MKCNKVIKLSFIFILIFFNNINNNYSLYKIRINNDTEYSNELNYTITEYKLKGLDFLNKCINESLINKIGINNSPKISVIIPIYNCQESIAISLKSIIFQNFKDLEIILVNDLSNDNSLNIIDKFHNNDQRIIVINNKKNMGTLYCRSIGALAAKGNYIFPLDNDDLFLFDDILEFIYKKASLEHYDVVEFKSFNIYSYHPLLNEIKMGDFLDHPNNLILHQPELRYHSISRNNSLHLIDHFLWAKSINSKVYKKAVNLLGKKRYSFYNCWTEDITVVFLIFKLANSFIFLNVFGIFHFKSPLTTTGKLKTVHRILTKIYFLDILIDFTDNNNKSKFYAVKYAIKHIYKKHYDYFKYLDKNQKLYINKTIKKLINNNYISPTYKNILIENFKIIK